MTSAEELMLLLELNGFDITKYKLKKQLEYENSGNIDLYKHKKFADLLICNYNYDDKEDYLHRNPLTYKEDWGTTINNLNQFYVVHPDLDEEITLKDFLKLKKFNAINKESILYDIFDNWVEEYRESSITQMENLRELVKILPKKNKKYKKPSRIILLISILLGLSLMFIYKSPDTLSMTFFNLFESLITGISLLLYEVSWYSLLGQLPIFGFVFYAVSNYFFGRFIKDIRGEKNKKSEKMFDKWEIDMQNIRLEQSGLLEDYVQRVIENPQTTDLDISTLLGPEILLNKFKNYVLSVHHKYDFMTKYYKKFIRSLRLTFVLSVLAYTAFIVVGFALLRGLI